MYILLLIVHIIVSVALIAIILSQASKGGGLEGVVGSAASNMFGAQGASEFLKKWTKYLAIVFFITSISLAMNTGKVHKSTPKAINKLKKELSNQKKKSTKQATIPVKDNKVKKDVDSKKSDTK